MSANLHNWQEKADYKDMRCLYCGKELALLKRLTGSEFCSDTHKQSYQDEYNRLALSRLQQAQSKSDDLKSKAAKAIQEAKPPEPKTHRTPEFTPLPEPEAVRTPEFTPAPEQVPVRVPAPAVAPVHEEPELVLTAMADFWAEERPSFRDTVFQVKPIPGKPADWSSQPWIPTFSAPGVMSETAALPRAELVPLALGLLEPASQPPRFKAELAVPHADNREFSPESLSLSLPIKPWSPKGLSWAQRVPIIVAPRMITAKAMDAELEAQAFNFETAYRESTRLELSLTGIAFPPEETEVALLEPGEAALDVPETNGTPRGALEALAKLHQAIKAEQAQAEGSEEEAAGEEVWPGPQEIDTEALERMYGEPPQIPAHASHQVEPVSDGQISVAVAGEAESPSVTQPELEPVLAGVEAIPVARGAAQMLSMPVKVFVPVKARLAPGFPALVQQVEPQIPRSDALPLRPKIAINNSPVAAPPRVEPAKPGPEPVARTVESKPAPKTEVPAGPQTSKPAVSTPEVKTTVRPLVTKPVTPAPVATPAKEAPSNAAAEPPKAPPPQPPPTTERHVEYNVPNLMLSSTGGWGGLSARTKMVAALAAVILVAALLYLSFGVQKKGGSAAGVEPVASSIMMGEGGWVTNWAGDSTGLHRGRQITIYRPSLKLSDCRIEFQGRIVNNSIGWVFRAADAGNYYAMKLAQTASGAKLQKYAVINGQEHDLGQVAVQPPKGGVFSVRVDARGPRFSTYIQGQPVDIWTDNQLKMGGVGFLNDRGDRADIKGVAISYLTGMGN